MSGVLMIQRGMEHDYAREAAQQKNRTKRLYTFKNAKQFTKGNLLAGYLEFYFAKQRGGLDPLSLNDQEKGPPLKGNSPYAW